MNEEINNKRLANIFLGIIAIVVFSYFGYGFLLAKDAPAKTATLSAEQKPTPTIALVDYLQYKGKTGKNALQLLQDQAQIEQATSGLVTSINGRKADNNNHEYWAFYINGKLAQVGPSDYQTKDEDLIEWKIEKY